MHVLPFVSFIWKKEIAKYVKQAMLMHLPKTVSCLMQIFCSPCVLEILILTDFFFNSRRWILERKLASSDVPNEERINLIKDLERKETEYMRLKRHKICVNDFELLTIIGRGAFGEVRTDTGMLIFVHERILVGHAMNHYLVLFGNGKSSACLPCKGCFLYYFLLTNSITG